jgi:hypothetical protein
MATLRFLLARFCPGMLPLEPGDDQVVSTALLRLRGSDGRRT